MAAVYYIIAREIDNDPHLLFRLRGIDLVSHFGSSVEHTLKPPFNLEVRDILPALPASPSDEQIVVSYSLPVFENYLNFIQSLLPASPPFSDRDFSITLNQFYHHAARSEFDSVLSQEDEGDWNIEDRFSRSQWSTVFSSVSPGATVSLLMQPLEGEAQEFHSYRGLSVFSFVFTGTGHSWVSFFV